MTSVPTFKLNTGATLPSVGMGCWMGEPGKGDEVISGLTEAFKVGYRHFDTAAAYANEKEVGIAINSSGVPREELFVTTKVWNDRHADVEAAFLESLEKLNTGYIDLYLMHWPQATKPSVGHGAAVADDSISFLDTWKSLEALIAKHPDKVKAIGVSNFSETTLQALLPHCKIVPAVNQIELHPYNPDHELVALCAKHNIHCTAYSPIGQHPSPLLGDPDLKAIADEIGGGITPAQVALSWNVQRGCSVAPKSSNPARMRTNITLVKLSPAQMERINRIGDDPARAQRLNDGPYDVATKTVFGWTLEQLGWRLGFRKQ